MLNLKTDYDSYAAAKKALADRNVRLELPLTEFRRGILSRWLDSQGRD